MASKSTRSSADRVETKNPASSDRIPNSTSSAGLESSMEISQQNTQTESVVTNESITLPETAPVIRAGSMPAGTKMPRQLWETTYSILREHKLLEDGNEGWMPIQVFQAEYARRTKKPFSSEYLQKMCGIKTIKQFFMDNPWIEFKITPDNSMHVRLSHPSFSNKAASNFCDVRPHYYPKAADTMKKLESARDEEILIRVPTRPQSTLPDGVFIPDTLRERVYRVLWFFYPQGTDITTFSMAYTKRYGTAFCPDKECVGVVSCDFFFKCIDDIVHSERGQAGILWMKPIEYQSLEKRDHARTRGRASSMAAAVSEMTERKPPPPSVLNELLSPLLANF